MLKMFVPPATPELVILAHDVVVVGFVAFGVVLHIAVVSSIGQCSMDCVVPG